MSKASEIIKYMQSLPANEEGWVPLDQQKMADAIGMPVGRLRNHMSAMAANKRWEWVKQRSEEHGRDLVVGFTNLNPPSKFFDNADGRMGRPRKQSEQKPKKAKTNGAAPEPAVPQPERRILRAVPTPELERIYGARSAMARFVADFPGIVDEARAQAAVRIDEAKAEAYAHEGMALLERNAWLEDRYRVTRAELAEARRELEYLRLKGNKQLQEGLASAGVTHSDPND